MSTQSTALSVVPSDATPPRLGAAALVPASLTEAAKLADLMSQASLVPQHLRGRPADCLLVIEQAMRWGMSPFAVAQSTSVIQGKLMHEGKLVAAVVNARGDLDEKLSYEFKGAGKDRAIVVKGRIRGEKEARTIEARIADMETRNEQWRKQPEQMAVYAGVRIWARRHTPELMLGVYAPEEFDAPAGGVEYTPPKGVAPSTNARSAAPATADASTTSSTTTDREPGADDDADEKTRLHSALWEVLTEAEPHGCGMHPQHARNLVAKWHGTCDPFALTVEQLETGLTLANARREGEDAYADALTDAQMRGLVKPEPQPGAMVDVVDPMTGVVKGQEPALTAGQLAEIRELQDGLVERACSSAASAEAYRIDLANRLKAKTGRTDPAALCERQAALWIKQLQRWGARLQQDNGQ